MCLFDIFGIPIYPTCTLKIARKGRMDRFWHKYYPNGTVQPAFIFFVGKSPAISWACQPLSVHLQGSLGRPQPELIWNVVLQSKRRHDNGEAFLCADGGNLVTTGSCTEAF